MKISNRCGVTLTKAFYSSTVFSRANPAYPRTGGDFFISYVITYGAHGFRVLAAPEPHFFGGLPRPGAVPPVSLSRKTSICIFH
nr:hypothetical protein [Candidatus Sigynarchaeota archaeon]